jgi:hypothetical protein
MIVTLSQQSTHWLILLQSFSNALWEKISALWQKVWSEISSSVSSFRKHPSYAYAFSQQSNADCHLQMWANFERLQLFRANDLSHNVVIHNKDYLTHREWLGKSFSDYTNWLQVKNQPKVKQYFEESISQAPLYPYFFDAQENNFFSYPLNPFEKGERKTLAPYFMKESSPSEFSYILPIYQQEGVYFCYDVDTEKYEPLQCNDSLRPEDMVLTSGQQKALSRDLSQLTLQKIPGQRAFVKAQDLEIAISEKFIPREMGTYKLLLLNLGLDSNNEEIHSNHSDYGVVEEMQKTAKERGTSWNPKLCKKEHLIEYALAELFKEEPILFESVKKHVDFYFKGWSMYENELMSLYDQNGYSLKNKNLDRYLPGKEQMLAYSLMKNIQYLWVNAMSSKAFCQHLGLPSFAKFIPCIVGPSRYCNAAYEDSAQDGRSFMNIWKDVKSRLVKEFPNKKDWVSFSGHGMIMSFDPDLIQKQNQRKISNRQLAEDLGVAGIDSLYGKNMDVFYRVEK